MKLIYKMDLNLSEESLDKGMDYTMLQMDQFMMESGLMIRKMVREKCYYTMDLSIMGNGKMTFFMAKAFLFLPIKIDMKEIF